MWKASAGHQIAAVNIQNDDDDDWETDPDFVNDVTEQEQRWGSKTVEGSGRLEGSLNVQQIREESIKAEEERRKKKLEETNPNYGYGGKFGVQKDRVDKSAENWDYKEKLQKHSSQKDYAEGFGGKFGVQKDRIDKSAVGWDHVEKLEKHESQKDYAKGFGGKFGIQEDRKDKSAVGWDHVETVEKHESQVDHKVGFGGKFGLQSDRMDKSAVGFDDENKQRIGTNYTKVKPDIIGAKSSSLRAKFENLAKNSEEEVKQRAAEQKRLREEKDKKDREEAAKKQVFESEVSAMNDQINSGTNGINRKGAISTGREGGIGNAISAFNQQAQSPTNQDEPTKIRKEPIKLPKEEVKAVQPDVIPTSKENLAINSVNSNSVVGEPLRESMLDNSFAQNEQCFENVIAPPSQFNQDNEQSQQHQIQPKLTQEPPVQQRTEEPIYQNQDDIKDYIEDTGNKAIALYDYQAAADDEISFDPDDIITHIEMIDEGWWRGLCKNRYGLFPANYVHLQVQEQQQLE